MKFNKAKWLPLAAGDKEFIMKTRAEYRRLSPKAKLKVVKDRKHKDYYEIFNTKEDRYKYFA